jgi:hypothetical protein
LSLGAGDDFGLGLGQQFSSHLQHLGSIVLTVPWTAAYHTIKKLGHNIVLKEIQHFVDYLFSFCA